ncbi:glycosyltransferase [Dickeya oryzae]
MINVNALIVTFKRKELLSRVISSLVSQSYPVNKIVVIDNNSDDGTKELVFSLQKKNSILIEYHNTGSNLGGAGGFNFGFKKIKSEEYDYLWIMDDDLLPEHDCLDNLLKVAEADEEAIIQPTRYNIDGSCAEYSPVKFDMSSVFIAKPKRETVIEYLNKNNNDLIQIDGIPFEGPLIPKKNS